MPGKAQGLLSYPVFQHPDDWLVLFLLERPSAKVLLEHLRDTDGTLGFDKGFSPFPATFPCLAVMMSLALGRQETHLSSLPCDPGGMQVQFLTVVPRSKAGEMVLASYVPGLPARPCRSP